MTEVCVCVCVCVGCLLTTMLLMAALDPHKYLPEIEDKAHQLMIIDPYRKLYYSDLCEYVCAWACGTHLCVGVRVLTCVWACGTHLCVVCERRPPVFLQ